MRRVLLIHQFSEQPAALQAALIGRGFVVHIEDQRWRAIQALRQPLPEWEFVVVVGNACEGELALLRDLIAASQQFHQSGLPEFVFAACSSCAPSLRFRIGSLGARYVRL